MSCRHLLNFILLATACFTVAAESVEFLEHGRRRYELLSSPHNHSSELVARPLGQSRTVHFGSRVIVESSLPSPALFQSWNPRLRLQGRVGNRFWILEAPTASDAVQAAAELSQIPGITLAVPTRKPKVRPHYSMAGAPNDPYFRQQYALESAATTTGFLPKSVDLNIREAWSWTRGEGVVVGVADDGIERSHADLSANCAGPNYNFLTLNQNGDPMALSLFHGTAVAGLIAAVGDNQVGLSGTAPRAKLASWVIFDDTDTNQPDEAGFAAMFATANQEVGVQNHSWGNADYSFVEVGAVENTAIENAIHQGRGGRGVILVRSSGNTRQTFSGGSAGDVNLDGYANDPRQITVAAVRTDGRWTSYSTPGSAILVAAPGGDYRGDYPGLLTTDRTGTAGLNAKSDPADPHSADYLLGSKLFVGTSAAAPLVTGVAALVISARPELRWFEVQQILALASRHIYLEDNEIVTNGAGLRISPNVGFGIPDAGMAVRMAKAWIPLPEPQRLVWTNSISEPIPDPSPGSTPQPLQREFQVDSDLIVQHVQIQVVWDHPNGQELKVTLTSPSGWVCPLLRTGTAAEAVPERWTFCSVQHLGESSYGSWKLEITDTSSGHTGRVDEVSLILRGRAIIDTDHDGLEDSWEERYFGSLNHGAQDDPDGDGWNNAAEQMAGRDPSRRDEAWEVFLARDTADRYRLTWPGTALERYEVWGRSDLSQPWTLVTNVPGRFPEAGWFFKPESESGLFEIRRVP